MKLYKIVSLSQDLIPVYSRGEDVTFEVSKDEAVDSYIAERLKRLAELGSDYKIADNVTLQTCYNRWKETYFDGGKLKPCKVRYVVTSNLQAFDWLIFKGEKEV